MLPNVQGICVLIVYNRITWATEKKNMHAYNNTTCKILPKVGLQ